MSYTKTSKKKIVTRNFCSIKIFIVELLEFKVEWFAFQKL